MQQCRFCYEDINEYARRCPKCHADLSFFGRLAGLRTLVSVLAALAGLGFGVYERFNAMAASQELQQEQAALMQVLDNVPESELDSKFGVPGKSEDQLKAELKKNPKNVDARIKLRMLQHRSHGRPGGFNHNSKSTPTTRTAVNEPKSGSNGRWNRR